MAEQVVTTLVVEIAGRQTNLEALITRTRAQVQGLAGASETAAQAVGARLGGSQERAAQQALSHARALAQLSAAQGDTAGAVQILRSALDGVDQSSTAAVRAQTQLANLQTRLARETTGARTALQQLRDTAAGFGQALGALGFAAGIGALGQFVSGAVTAANSLEKTQATIRAVAGDSRTYAEVLRIAEQNQKLFGGSLEANLGPLQQFLFIANRTGASLDELNRVAQLLATVNPAAGIDGAGFALSELLSGDVQSIVERFNLPRQAVRELLAESQDAGDVLNGVTALLSEQGVTAETLSASLDTNAQAYDRLGAVASTAFTNIGAAASQAFRPVVDFLTAGLEGFNQLAAAGGQIDAVQASLLAGTTTYAEYQAAAAGVNEQLGQIGARLPGLSEAQVAYAQALIATGVNEQTALAAAQARAEELSRISQFTTAATNENNLYYESLSELPGIIAEIIAADETQIAALDNLILAYNLGGISAEELAAQVLLKADSVAAAAQADAEAEAAALAAANANNAAALSMDLATQAASAEEQALRAATTAAFDAANAGADLDAQARAAADALFAAGNAGASVAEQLARSSNRVDVLTAAYYRLAQAQAAAAGGAVGGASGALDIGGARDGAGDATERLRDRIRAISAFGPIGGSGGRSRGSGGGSGASTADREAERAATEARKFEEQRLRDQERINEQIRDAEEEHYGRLLDIQAEYEERSLQQQRENESDKRRSRFSFYSELTSSDLPQDIQQQLSAAYEEAFAQAQQYAAEGKQELANEYLALKQDQLEAELAFQEAVAAAREKGDQAEVQRLEALAKLRRDAEQAELNNLLAEGDQNVNRRDEAIAEESQRYEDDQAKIADAVEQASQRKVKATDESRAAIEAETRALREQADLLEQLNRQRIPTGESTPADGTPTAPAIPNTQPTSQPAASTTLPDGADTGALLAELQRLVSQGESQLRALSDLARAIDRSAAAQRSIVNKHG